MTKSLNSQGTRSPLPSPTKMRHRGPRQRPSEPLTKVEAGEVGSATESALCGGAIPRSQIYILTLPSSPGERKRKIRNSAGGRKLVLRFGGSGDRLKRAGAGAVIPRTLPARPSSQASAELRGAGDQRPPPAPAPRRRARLPRASPRREPPPRYEYS